MHSVRQDLHSELNARPSAYFEGPASIYYLAILDAENVVSSRVQVEVEEQGSNILNALNRRAKTQIKIQQAVEGFSVTSISYY